MDGVLLDSEPLWQRAEIEVFGRLGLDLAVEDCLQTMGLRVDEVVTFWYAARPWPGPGPVEVVDTLLARVRALFLAEAVALPGLAELLDRLRRRAVPVALATSSPLRLVDAVLRRLDLGGVFAVVASAEHEPFGKPHPGVYLTAAAGLGIAPTECVAIEDSVNGVIAAKAARMRCVAVPSAEIAADPRFAIADASVAGLAAIDDVLLGLST